VKSRILGQKFFHYEDKAFLKCAFYFVV